MKIDAISILLEQSFRQEAEINGLGWRTARTATFVDMLMLLAHRAATKGIDSSICTEIILTSFKAIVNEQYGPVEFTTSFNKLNVHLSIEMEEILSFFRSKIAHALKSAVQNQLAPYDAINYFKVLNNLEIEGNLREIFEDTFLFFVKYMDHQSLFQKHNPTDFLRP